nr:patatin-like phospholipase family protein [Peptoniphilus coxii]
MAYGLVLEGGGAKGSYQLGAYMAVQEMKPDIRLVVGTSIGALNGAFIVQGNTDELARIWSKISFDNGGDVLCSRRNQKGDRSRKPCQDGEGYAASGSGALKGTDPPPHRRRGYSEKFHRLRTRRLQRQRGEDEIFVPGRYSQGASRKLYFGELLLSRLCAG